MTCMNILMLYTHNPIHTSGVIPMDMFNELKKTDHKVKLIVNSYDPNYPEDLVSMKTFIYSEKKFVN